MKETITEYINMTWVYWGLMIAYAVTILSIIGVVLTENRNPVKSLAWITVLLTLPALGLILYFLFGRSIKNKRYISRRNRRRLKRHEPGKPFDASSSDLSPESCQLIKLGQGLMSSPFYKGNSASFYSSGREKFAALKADIAKAKRFIYLQYYIISDDRLGNEISSLLMKKAAEGVKVKVIYDHVGSFRTRRKFFKRLREAGIEAYPFFKVHFPVLGTRVNWRNHRKIAVIDGRVAYIGGMNVADRYIDGGKRKCWHDAHLRVKGPIIRSLLHSFAADWNFMGRPLPDGINVTDPKPQEEDFGMQMITSGPMGQWSNIAMAYQKAIGNAKSTIWIQTPYFLPNEGLLKALQSAALAKVDVRIMMPRRSDSALLTYASFSYIKESLQSGIKIYLYKPGMLHSKLMIIDDEIVSVGSTNFDFRSFEHNFESNLFVYSKEFNASMRERFIADQEECERVVPYAWSRRSRKHKILESFMRLFAPIL